MKIKNRNIKNGKFTSPINTSFIQRENPKNYKEEKNISKKFKTPLFKFKINEKKICKFLIWLIIFFLLIFLLYLPKYKIFFETEKKIKKAKIENEIESNLFEFENSIKKNENYWKEINTQFIDCDEIQKFYDLLKNQNFTISENLPELPNMQKILEDDNNLQNENYLIKKNNFSEKKLQESITSFNNLIPFGKIFFEDPKKNFEKIDEKILKEKNRYREPLKFLDNNFIEFMKLKTNDLYNSYNNLLSKKLELNNFRKNYFDLMKKLKVCKKIMGDYNKSLENKKNLKNESLKKIQDLENKMRLIMEEIEEKEKKFYNEKLEKRKELGEIKMKIDDLELMKIKKPEILKKISELESSRDLFIQQKIELENKIKMKNEKKLNLETEGIKKELKNIIKKKAM